MRPSFRNTIRTVLEEPDEQLDEPQPRSKLARALCVATCTATAGLALFAATALADPIASGGPAPSLPAFQGVAAKSHPIKGTTKPPQNPFLARNPNSNIHNDTWMTDAYQRAGPARAATCRRRRSEAASRCAARIAFDTPGPARLASARPRSPRRRRGSSTRTRWRRSRTYDLPECPRPARHQDVPELHRRRLLLPRQPGPHLGADQDRPHLRPRRERRRPQLEKVGDYDLTGVLDAANERITSALPDFKGRIWFVSKQNGKIGTLDPKTGADQGAEARRGGRELLRRGQAGRVTSSPTSGCTASRPAGTARRTSLEGRLHELRDRQAGPGRRRLGHDADDHERRLRRDHRQRRPDERRRLPHRREARARASSASSAGCPVFAKGASATENSLLGAGRSLIVENNYGYQDPFGPNTGAVTSPASPASTSTRTAGAAGSVWTNHDVARADRRAEALDQDRADLHLHQRPRTRAARRATTGRRSTSAPARPRGSSTRAPASTTTTTTPASRSARTAPPTWA